MRKKFAGVAIALMLTASGAVRTSWAQKASVPKQQDTVALAREKAIELLLLMDTNKNGIVSKQKWMKFMEAEFDRLDKDKKGELDPRELQRSNLPVSHSFRGLGK
jgi:EF hand